ncbi:hypothetical protein V6Z11_D03G007800 [Gossypium hirsutum]
MGFLSQIQTYFWTIILFLFMVLNCHVNEAALVLPKNVTVTAVFVFGDSIVDPAEEFGVKESVPAYLDPKTQLQDLLTGVSFASGAAGYDPLTAKSANVIAMSGQLELFKECIKKIKGAVGEERAATIISKAIYIVCTGSNDISNTYFSTPFRRPHYDINGYAEFNARYANQFLQDLYGLGARRIGLYGLPPIGCVPSQRTIGGGKNRDCYEAGNQLAIAYNTKLSGVIDSLKAVYTLPNTKLIFFDIYYPLLSIIQNPAKYGITKEGKTLTAQWILNRSTLNGVDLFFEKRMRGG